MQTKHYNEKRKIVDNIKKYKQNSILFIFFLLLVYVNRIDLIQFKSQSSTQHNEYN
jgi:hypothetical protein